MSKKTKTYDIPEEVAAAIVAEKKSLYGIKTYVSLFSSAGIGCYGFKEAGFSCIATVELLERRLKFRSLIISVCCLRDISAET